jgi:hypothetical protein
MLSVKMSIFDALSLFRADAPAFFVPGLSIASASFLRASPFFDAT